ncbi:zinc ribbon domain-containing protein [Clostridium sp.]
MGLLENWTNSLQEKQGSGVSSQKGFDAQIASTEKQIQDTLAEIGKVYVQQHGLDCEPEYVELVNQIQSLEEQKAVLERNKLAAQGLRICDHCHQIITLDSAFCNKCGSKLEPIVPSSAGGRFCPACGASLAEGDVFCVTCGAKIN